MMFVSLLYFVVAWAFLFICESLISFVILVILICFLFFFFFLSSRRRHTRLQDDWSSDVCSSDLQGVANAALEVQTVVETVKRERLALEDVQKQIRQAHEELRDVKQSVEQAAALRGELEQLRGVATQLTQDYSKAREISREADDDAFAALEAVKDIEKRLSRLAQLQELGRTTDEKLTALNSLAEHVTQKTRILEGQKNIVDRAVVEINHVNELV